ncbi:GntR family transcriptional regulator [Enterococcus sp.]|uniref:GntR family transcriptional regulator n=1 Tax=Enterococcus sp. TaxID=35783 RepID=UPI003C78E3EA
MSNGMPYYLQIADEMRTNIRIEKWKEGDKIPTEHELCDIYHVSRITVRKAIEELVKDNLLIRKRAKGTFVKSIENIQPEHFTLVKSFTEEMKEIGIVIETTKVNIIINHADKKISQYLDVPIGEKVILLKRLRKFDKQNLAYFLTYFKYDDMFSLNSFDYYGSFYSYLNHLGISVNNNREIIEAIHPTQEIAYVLHISQNTPVLKRVRFASEASGNFKEYTECYYIGNEYKYFVDFS